MRYISLPSDLNATIAIKSCYCVIQNMVILYDAIQTIQNSVFVFFLKKEQRPVSFQKTRKNGLKKHVNCFFLNSGFFNPDYLSILFCDFPLIARSGTSHVIISLIGCAPHT